MGPKLNKISRIKCDASYFCTISLTTLKYVIFGRDLFQELGIQLDFQNNIIGWHDINVPMKLLNCKMRTHSTVQDSKQIRNATKRIKKILYVNYEKANLEKIVDNLKYLSDDKQSLILKLLRQHEEIFDSILGN